MNLHDLLMELGSTHYRMNGKGFSDLLTIDIQNRTIKNGSLYLMKRGRIVPQTITVNEKELVLDDCLGKYEGDFFEGLEERYGVYFTSLPNKHDYYQRSCLEPKGVNDLTMDEMINGTARAVARYELEWWILVHAINKQIPWNHKHNFWKSSKYNKLILRREDVEGRCY